MNNTEHLLFENELAQLFIKYNVPQAFLFYIEGNDNSAWKLVVDDKTRPLHDGINSMNRIIELFGPDPIEKGGSIHFVKDKKK